MLSNFGKKSPFARLTALMFTLVGALLLAGCGSSAAAAPTATTVPTATTIPTATPTPILDTAFTSPDSLYTFKFPGTWTQNPINQSPFVNGVSLISPDTKNYFVVLPANQGFAATQDLSLFKGFLGGFGKNAVVKPTESNQTLGKNTWRVYEGTVTQSTGVASQAAQFALTHAGKSFYIIIIADNATADTEASMYFLPMITSLTFLK